MKRSLPAPPVRLFVGKARVLMPTFVEELVWTIRQIAPSQRGDGVDHLPEFGLRVLDLIQRLPESFLRSLAFNCDTSDVARRLDQLKLSTVRGPRLRIGYAQGPENLSRF
jgi:hypothetical protein